VRQHEALKRKGLRRIETSQRTTGPSLSARSPENKGIAFQQYIAKIQYMKATPLDQTNEVRDDGTIIVIVIWRVPQPISPCAHLFKYSLFFGRPGKRMLGYDNEQG